MKIVFSAIIILTASFASAHGGNAAVDSIMSTAKRCGSPELTTLERVLIESELSVVRAQRKVRPFERAPIVIPVYFHVLAKTNAEADGNVSDDMIDEQMEVLNEGFKTMNIRFELAGVDRNINAQWFNMGFMSSTKTSVKEKLVQGNAGALNLYTAAPAGGTLGWATFPWEYSSKPKRDGVVIHYQTLPGGAMTQYNLGATAVHEVGHWLGLYHTFQGGCNGGDSVDDTPAEKTANFGCPAVAPDTCPGPGKDPIHNFMDYSDDICLTEFSGGQVNRVHDSYDTYRN